MAQASAWPAIAAVIFDLDGVLTDTAEYHYRAWKRLADEEGIPFSRAENEALRGVSRRKSLDILLKGRPVTEAQAQEMMARKNRYYQEFIRHMTPAELLPGAVQLLDELRAAGIKVAVASASKNARTVLDGLHLWEHIDSLSDGTSVSRSKPAPDLFLHAAAQVGVAPWQCLVGEDAAAGIQAAQAAGMHTLALGPAERFAHVSPEARLPSLEGTSWAGLRQLLADSQAAASTWMVSEDRLDPTRLGWHETVYTVGNGYLGTRGTFEERYPGDQPATLINGLFDGVPIIHTELAAVPDWLSLELWVDGERFALDRGRLLAYERTLDMRTGVVARRVRWQSPGGRTVEIYLRRWASLDDEHLCALRCGVTALDFSGDVEVRATIDAVVENPGNLVPSEVGLTHWWTLGHGPASQGAWLHARTRVSGAELGAAMHLGVEGVPEASYSYRDYRQAPGVAARVHLAQGTTAVATKLVAYATTAAQAEPAASATGQAGTAAPQGSSAQAAQAPPLRALSRLEAALDRRYEALLAAHRAAWQDLWRSCDIEIEGDEAAQRAVRFNLYQLLIAAPRHTGRVSIPAKTLSGFGYRGHVFWDTDIFIVPFFTYTRPELARNLLLYRYHTLPGARENARRAGFKGAWYAWESADDGRETTPPWVPLPDGSLARCWCGDIELHINTDVAYALWQYWQTTRDDEFMRDYGAEVLLDTAAFWGSRVQYNAEAERYEITDVIGPDEYHEHVANNAYTNRMVQWHLRRALETLDWLRREHAGKAEDLERRLALNSERLALWKDIGQRMYIPYDPATGLFEQFAGFFQLQDLDWQALEPRTQPVQMVLGIEETQRYQALKQPDALMLLYLLGEAYDERILRVNWQYYEPRTDHTYGSSLGPAIHTLLAARLGLLDDAYQHFTRAALMDLEDLRGNTRAGIHAASAGGVWQDVVLGFAGLHASPEGLAFTPRLPERWRRLRFTVQYRGQGQAVDIRAEELVGTAEQGNAGR